MKKLGLHYNYTKTWLEDLKKALKCPNFKVKPVKNPEMPKHLTKEEMDNFLKAIALLKRQISSTPQ